MLLYIERAIVRVHIDKQYICILYNIQVFHHPKDPIRAFSCMIVFQIHFHVRVSSCLFVEKGLLFLLMLVVDVSSTSGNECFCPDFEDSRGA